MSRIIYGIFNEKQISIEVDDNSEITIDGGGNLKIKNIEDNLEWNIETFNKSGESQLNPFLGERSMRDEDRK